MGKIMYTISMIIDKYFLYSMTLEPLDGFSPFRKISKMANIVFLLSPSMLLLCMGKIMYIISMIIDKYFIYIMTSEPLDGFDGFVESQKSAKYH